MLVAEAHLNLARTLVLAGRPDEAVPEFLASDGIYERLREDVERRHSVLPELWKAAVDSQQFSIALRRQKTC